MFNLDDERILNAINDKMDEITDNIFANSQSIIVQKQLVDEGTLLKSGTIERDYLNKSITYGVSYAEEIEYGRSPGTMPPIEPIKQWIRRKGLVKTEAGVNRFAFNIIKDIKANGQEPRPFLVPAIDMEKNKFK